MDKVLRALANPTRRSVLDALFVSDGQTVTALVECFPISRIGVMKHLRVLEEAGLIVTKRRGREKLHFLNTVPIRLVHDRWVSEYAERWTAALVGFKQELETMMERYSRSISRPPPNGFGRQSPTQKYEPSTTSARQSSRIGQLGPGS